MVTEKFSADKEEDMARNKTAKAVGVVLCLAVLAVAGSSYPVNKHLTGYAVVVFSACLLVGVVLFFYSLGVKYGPGYPFSAAAWHERFLNDTAAQEHYRQVTKVLGWLTTTGLVAFCLLWICLI